jgi:hypothetical protein
VRRTWSLPEAASLEEHRTARSGRCFSLLRIAPAGWAADARELEALEGLVAANLRRTDVVLRVRDRELGIVLVELAQAEEVVRRLRPVLAAAVAGVEMKFGWGAVGPGHARTWQEGWRWAGQLLLVDGEVRAAA